MSVDLLETITKGKIVLRTIRKLREGSIGASDGDIGHVDDCYLDDRNWTIRYMVADTDSWMPGRVVLLAPHVFCKTYQGGKALRVSLTRQQIKMSPSIGLHQKVSR